MNYILEFSQIALKDIEKHKKSGDKAVLKKNRKIASGINGTSANRNRSA